MFGSRRSSHLLDHGNYVSGREARKAMDVQAVVASLSCAALTHTASLELMPAMATEASEPVHTQLPLVYMQQVA